MSSCARFSESGVFGLTPIGFGSIGYICYLLYVCVCWQHSSKRSNIQSLFEQKYAFSELFVEEIEQICEHCTMSVHIFVFWDDFEL
jgi:hypothetical protein